MLEFQISVYRRAQRGTKSTRVTTPPVALTLAVKVIYNSGLSQADSEVNCSCLEHKRQHHFLLKLLDFKIATALSSSRLIAFYDYCNGNTSNILASFLTLHHYLSSPLPSPSLVYLQPNITIIPFRVQVEFYVNENTFKERLKLFFIKNQRSSEFGAALIVAFLVL